MTEGQVLNDMPTIHIKKTSQAMPKIPGQINSNLTYRRRIQKQVFHSERHKKMELNHNHVIIECSGFYDVVLR